MLTRMAIFFGVAVFFLPWAAFVDDDSHDSDFIQASIAKSHEEIGTVGENESMAKRKGR